MSLKECQDPKVEFIDCTQRPGGLEQEVSDSLRLWMFSAVPALQRFNRDETLSLNNTFDGRY